MQAIICARFGPPETLELREVESRGPEAGEVRVAVAAAGVNFPDTLIIEGKYQVKPDLPFSPGSEIAGTVVEVGPEVEGFAVGDPVMGTIGYGAFREEVTAAADHFLVRPSWMDPAVAAGFSMTYGTSMHALKQRARLQPGETLLVLGTAGGVGIAAVEIGKAMGARVIAAASSSAKLEAARKAGADETIDYSQFPLKEQVKELTGGQGADVVYDPVDGDLFEQALRATAWEGRVLVVGFASGSIPRPPVNLTLLKGCAIVGVYYGAFRKRQPQANAENFEELFAWCKAGRLNPLVSRTLPLKDAPEALREVAGRRAIGKIVLVTGR